MPTQEAPITQKTPETLTKQLGKAIQETGQELLDAIKQNQAKPQIKLGEFPGVYHKFQLREFGNMVRCGVAREFAHKVAFDFGSSIGVAIQNGDDTLKTKVGKANKDGESKLTISGGGKLGMSPAMSIVRIFQVVDGLFIEGLLKSRKVLDLDKLTDNIGFEPDNGTPSNLRDYVKASLEWIDRHEFVK